MFGRTLEDELREGAKIPLVTLSAHGRPQDEDLIANFPQSKQPSRFKRWKHGRQHSTARSAWRFTVKSGALAAGLVLLVNSITTIVTFQRSKGLDSNFDVFQGSCATSNGVIISSHIIINILSTVLLAYSNYAMQCLGSPTRAEVDHAHNKSVWLTIATPTIRNLFFVSRSKALLWVMLGLSSFPIHLLWNAAVFQTQTTNNYLAVSVTEDFLHGANWTLSSVNFTHVGVTASYNPTVVSDTIKDLQDLAQNSSAGRLEYLDNKECVRLYGRDRQSDRRHVLLVVDTPSPTPTPAFNSSNAVVSVYSVPFAYASDLQYRWMCNFGEFARPDPFYNGGGWECPKQLLHNLDDPNYKWIPGLQETPEGDSSSITGQQEGAPVKYCYSETVEGQCKVSVTPVLLLIVCICNAVKIVALVWSLRITRRDPPLVTTGDAIQSFLERPDQYTRGRCLVSKYDYDTKFGFGTSREWRVRPSTTADVWTGGRHRLGKALGNTHWVIFMLFVSTAIIISGAFYGTGGLGFGTTQAGASLLSLGLGEPHPNFVVTDNLADSDGLHEYYFTSAQIAWTISANTPQIIVSYLYLAYGNILTSMLSMKEYCSYAANPSKGLRVSSPQPDTAQRSTFFLSVPYRWAIPSIIGITTVHWLVSQMVFLAHIQVFEIDGTPDYKSSVVSIFFSPLAMMFAVSLASLMLVVLIVIGIFMKFPNNVPLAGNCSASIAAACQPVAEKDDHVPGLATRKLRWGVASYNEAGVGHATFDDRDPDSLVVQRYYS